MINDTIFDTYKQSICLKYHVQWRALEIFYLLYNSCRNNTRRWTVYHQTWFCLLWFSSIFLEFLQIHHASCCDSRWFQRIRRSKEEMKAVQIWEVLIAIFESHYWSTVIYRSRNLLGLDWCKKTNCHRSIVSLVLQANISHGCNHHQNHHSASFTAFPNLPNASNQTFSITWLRSCSWYATLLFLRIAMPSTSDKVIRRASAPVTPASWMSWKLTVGTKFLDCHALGTFAYSSSTCSSERPLVS